MRSASEEKRLADTNPPPDAAPPLAAARGQETASELAAVCGSAMASELAGISRDQMRDLFSLAYAVAMAITKSKPRSDELVQTTFERLMTTRRWDGKKPIEAHVAGIVKSLASNEHVSKKPERGARAHDGFHREVVGESTPSAEDRATAMAADETRQKSAENALDALAASVAEHPLAPRVLQKRIEGVRKPAEIARALGASVEDVYRANDVLRRHLRAIRKDRGEDDEGEKT